MASPDPSVGGPTAGRALGRSATRTVDAATDQGSVSGASRICEGFLRAHQAATPPSLSAGPCQARASRLHAAEGSGPPIRRSAGWLAQDAPNATRLAQSLAGSPALPRPEGWAQFPSTVAPSADIPLPCSSRI